MNEPEALARAATYLKWWRDSAIAEAEPPADINDVIRALEDLGGFLQRRELEGRSGDV